jgi:hypothetical protein
LRQLFDLGWTPVNVIYKILGVLGDSPKAKFVDIGSGVGKVCIALSYLTEWEIFGLEQSVGLHDIDTPGDTNSTTNKEGSG